MEGRLFLARSVQVGLHESSEFEKRRQTFFLSKKFPSSTFVGAQHDTAWERECERTGSKLLLPSVGKSTQKLSLLFSFNGATGKEGFR